MTLYFRFCTAGGLIIILVIFHHKMLMCCESICELVCRPLKNVTGSSAAGERYKQRQEERARDRRREAEMVAEDREQKHAIKLERRKRELSRLRTQNAATSSVEVIDEQPIQPRKSWKPFKQFARRDVPVILYLTLRLNYIYCSRLPDTILALILLLWNLPLQLLQPPST
jgi:hypothetical protein